MDSVRTNAIEKIAEAVKNKGGTAYYVGGYVRDELMHKNSDDIDIEIHGIGCDMLEDILDSAGERIEIGKSFGIYNLKGLNVDFAMPRKEYALGKGHRDFKIYTDPYIGTEKASLRRDFTINAIMKNVLTGEIIDHFGGIEDIKNGVIRHINNESFKEDPLRVLRGAQFAARFEFEIADETIALCKKMDLTQLSKERVFDEMKKALLKSEKPSLFFENLRKADALSYWFREVCSLIGTEQSTLYHREGDVWNHTMMVLDEAAKRRGNVQKPLWFMIAALCHDFGKPVSTESINGVLRSLNHETEGIPIVEEFLQRITSEKNLIKYVLNLTHLHMRPNKMAADKSSIKSTNKLFDSTDFPLDLLELSASDRFGKIPRPENSENEIFLKERLKIYNEYMSRPYVEGKDLIKEGIEPGESYRKLLEHAHELRLAGVSKDEALRQIVALNKKGM
ncbi:MAG: HD domain-containing protein [Ruminococcaceae bacterium]|nr:HD domain-containing protein [Oscillospiraceae bacterium]